MRGLRQGALTVCAGLALALVGCQEGEVTAPALSATCEASPAAGPAPLSVRFLLSVAGAEGPVRVEVAYGDGTTGSDPDVPHTYATAGAYTASFSVSTATQNARCAAAVAVASAPTPTPVANRPPNAIFKSTPDDAAGTISGRAPFSVRFNMCASWDPDGDRLFFLMDFNGDRYWDWAGRTGAHCRHDNVFAQGSHNVRTCVYDETETFEVLHQAVCKNYTVVATP